MCRDGRQGTNNALRWLVATERRHVLSFALYYSTGAVLRLGRSLPGKEGLQCFEETVGFGMFAIASNHNLYVSQTDLVYC